MKKYLMLLSVALVVLAACEKETVKPENEEASAPITFNLTANHPKATKAVKTGWENGDVIFVFFNNVQAPKYLKMSYNGSSWSSEEMDGASAGSLGLSNGDAGTMRAVYLPFGNGATVAESNGSFVFNKVWYTYYLTGTLDYKVVDGTVSGAFSMEVPEGYVQFYMQAASPEDEAYYLGIDAVIPTGVASIAADGSIVESSDKTYIDDMPGYAYVTDSDKGYLFSGKLNDSYDYGRNGSYAYYFARTKVADGSRCDYFVTGKALSSHASVELAPETHQVYWHPVGPDKKAALSVKDHKLVHVQTCNYGASAPEEVGTILTFEDAAKLDGSVPDYDYWADLTTATTNSPYSWSWVSIHGKEGMVVKTSTYYGYANMLFLPVQNSGEGWYWSSSEESTSKAHGLWLKHTANDLGLHTIDDYSKTQKFAVRQFAVSN